MIGAFVASFSGRRCIQINEMRVIIFFLGIVV